MINHCQRSFQTNAIFNILYFFVFQSSLEINSIIKLGKSTEPQENLIVIPGSVTELFFKYITSSMFDSLNYNEKNSLHILIE